MLSVPLVTAGAISFTVLEKRELSVAETMTKAARAGSLSSELIRLNRFGGEERSETVRWKIETNDKSRLVIHSE